MRRTRSGRNVRLSSRLPVRADAGVGGQEPGGLERRGVADLQQDVGGGKRVRIAYLLDLGGDFALLDNGFQAVRESGQDGVRCGGAGAGQVWSSRAAGMAVVSLSPILGSCVVEIARSLRRTACGCRPGRRSGTGSPVPRGGGPWVDRAFRAGWMPVSRPRMRLAIRVASPARLLSKPTRTILSGPWLDFEGAGRSPLHVRAHLD